MFLGSQPGLQVQLSGEQIRDMLRSSGHSPGPTAKSRAPRGTDQQSPGVGRRTHCCLLASGCQAGVSITPTGPWHLLPATGGCEGAPPGMHPVTDYKETARHQEWCLEKKWCLDVCLEGPMEPESQSIQPHPVRPRAEGPAGRFWSPQPQRQACCAQP